MGKGSGAENRGRRMLYSINTQKQMTNNEQKIAKNVLWGLDNGEHLCYNQYCWMMVACEGVGFVQIA